MLKLLYKGLAIGGARSLGAVFGISYTLSIAWTLGVGNSSDALFAAFIIPVGLWQSIPSILGQVTIPYLTQVTDEAEKQQVLQSISALVWGGGILCMLLYLIFPDAVVFATAGGLNQKATAEALYYLQVLAPIFPMTLICGYLQAYLNSDRIFFPVEISILLWKAIPLAVLIVAALVGGNAGKAAVWGLTLGSFVRVWYLLKNSPPAAVKLLLRPMFRLKHSLPHQIKSLFKSEAILVGADWTLMTFVRFLGSMLPFGGLSIYNYGDKFVCTFPLQLIKGIGTVLLTDMAKARINEGNSSMFAKVVIMCAVPGAVLSAAIYNAAPLMADFVLLTGHMTQSQLEMLEATIKAFAPSIFAMMIIMACQLRLFLSYKKMTFVLGNLIQLTVILLGLALYGLEAPVYLASYMTVSMYFKMFFFLFAAIRMFSSGIQGVFLGDQNGK